MTDVKPALDAEEWAHWLQPYPTGGQLKDRELDWARSAAGVDQLALAALALYGQPFGFTREMAESVEQCASYALIEAGVCPICGDEIDGRKSTNPPRLMPCGHRPRFGHPDAEDATLALRAATLLAALLPPEVDNG